MDAQRMDALKALVYGHVEATGVKTHIIERRTENRQCLKPLTDCQENTLGVEPGHFGEQAKSRRGVLPDAVYGTMLLF
jgi:hypothetical protein